MICRCCKMGYNGSIHCSNRVSQLMVFFSITTEPLSNLDNFNSASTSHLMRPSWAWMRCKNKTRCASGTGCSKRISVSMVMEVMGVLI